MLKGRRANQTNKARVGEADSRWVELRRPR